MPQIFHLFLTAIFEILIDYFISRNKLTAAGLEEKYKNEEENDRKEIQNQIIHSAAKHLL